MSQLNEHILTNNKPTKPNLKFEKNQKLEQVHIYGVSISNDIDSGVDRVKHVNATTREVIQKFNEAGAKYILSISETPGKDNPEEVSQFINSITDKSTIITVVPSDGAIYKKRFLVVRPVGEVVITESSMIQRIMKQAKAVFDTMM